MFNPWTKAVLGEYGSQQEAEARMVELRAQGHQADWDDTRDPADTQFLRVPDAPFKNTWHELAFKRMLVYAIENGFEQLA